MHLYYLLFANKTYFHIFGYCLPRSSHPEVFYKKGFLRNFGKFTEKQLLRLWHRCFPVNFGKFLRPPFFTEHLP